MGREIRRVPPNWEHPRWTKEDAPYEEHIGEYRPCYDETYEEAAEKWLCELAKWEAGENSDRYNENWGTRYYWDAEGGPPDKETYRPAFDAEPTWFQVYETVSEGTPVSPPFANEDELIDYLVINGDDWDQRRGEPAPSRESVERFVKGGYAPSMMVLNPADGSPIAIGVGIHSHELMEKVERK